MFWNLWCARNKLVFENKVPSAQRIKANFVTNLWSWAKLYSADNSHSVIDFFVGWGVGSFLVGFVFFAVGALAPCCSRPVYPRVLSSSDIFVFYRSKKKKKLFYQDINLRWFWFSFVFRPYVWQNIISITSAYIILLSSQGFSISKRLIRLLLIKMKKFPISYLYCIYQYIIFILHINKRLIRLLLIKMKKFPISLRDVEA